MSGDARTVSDGPMVGALFEIQLSATVNDEHAKRLAWLKRQIGSDLVNSIIITTGRYAYRRADVSVAKLTCAVSSFGWLDRLVASST
ncbi:MAG: hypothetical protein LBV00_11640 [Propionibacteriaceae bacterium]|jgi:hypothetical protein|nr:hypothetical protein [Propionibacteriaceae bacterium]